LPVILAGGGGTRLWPLSRENHPKQFLSVGGGHSMLQQTLLRVRSVDAGFAADRPVLLCNETHRFLVAEHARQIDVELREIILEPAGRNTAPALTIAALRAGEGDPVLLMMPADHHIEDVPAFHEAVRLGFVEAGKGNLVTFGVRPLSPETGYGYVQAVPGADHGGVLDVGRFLEKPDAKTAARCLDAGDYYWNSGIFMMKASIWLEAVRQFCADIHQACHQATASASRDGLFYRLPASFSDCRSDSIDYAVMEKAAVTGGRFRTVMVPLDAGWSDLGSWSSLWEISGKDEHNNAITGDVFAEQTRNSIIQSHSRLMAVIGCDNLLVIETPDAVLVGRRTDSENVKKVVEKLGETGRKERTDHRRVHRPWGSYETVDSGAGFQVKRLVVSPGKKLSLQLHHHRAEHWVVVRGVATVTREDQIFDLRMNESTYIPAGHRHRLENRQDVPLEVIEVQSGDYLGEDDIVRFDDDFGRT